MHCGKWIFEESRFGPGSLRPDRRHRELQVFGERLKGATWVPAAITSPTVMTRLRLESSPVTRQTTPDGEGGYSARADGLCSRLLRQL